MRAWFLSAHFNLKGVHFLRAAPQFCRLEKKTTRFQSLEVNAADHGELILSSCTICSWLFWPAPTVPTTVQSYPAWSRGLVCSAGRNQGLSQRRGRRNWTFPVCLFPFIITVWSMGWGHLVKNTAGKPQSEAFFVLTIDDEVCTPHLHEVLAQQESVTGATKAPSRSFWSAGPLCLTRQGWCVWSQFRCSSSQYNTKHRQENTHSHLKCITLYLKQASVSAFNKQLLSTHSSLMVKETLWPRVEAGEFDIYQVVLGNSLVHGIVADAVCEHS